MANFLQAWRKFEICTTRPGGPSPPDKSDIDNQGLAVAWGFRHHRVQVSRSILQDTDIPAPNWNNICPERHILAAHRRH